MDWEEPNYHDLRRNFLLPKDIFLSGRSMEQNWLNIVIWLKTLWLNIIIAFRPHDVKLFFIQSKQRSCRNYWNLKNNDRLSLFKILRIICVNPSHKSGNRHFNGYPIKELHWHLDRFDPVSFGFQKQMVHHLKPLIKWF